MATSKPIDLLPLERQLNDTLLVLRKSNDAGAWAIVEKTSKEVANNLRTRDSEGESAYRVAESANDVVQPR